MTVNLRSKNANQLEYTFPQRMITNTKGHEDLWMFHGQFLDTKNSVVKCHFPDNCFIEANMSALLLAICHKLKETNGLAFEIGDCSGTLLDLFRRNGLISHIENDAVLKSYDYRQSTVSAQLFHLSDAQKFYDYIDHDLLSHPSLDILDADAKDMLRQGFLETFHNIEHIDSDLPLAACGQCFPTKKHLNFTLSDMGVGFLRKIRHFTEGVINTPKEAIAWAVKGGNTVREDGEGGLGLSRLRKYCEQDKRFTFIIITDGHYWKLSDGETSYRSLSYPIVGTTIHLKVKLMEKP